MESVHSILKRQFGQGGNGNDGGSGGDDGGDDGQEQFNGYNGQQSWWWTPAGMATRYAIVALIFAAALLFILGGYYHAQRRMRQGLPPLPYHRWMVRSSRWTHSQHPRYQNPRSYGYAMEGYPPPPPAYNAAEMPPPVYQPPEGASKAMADQDITHLQQSWERRDGGSSNGAVPGATTVAAPAASSQN